MTETNQTVREQFEPNEFVNKHWRENGHKNMQFEALVLMVLDAHAQGYRAGAEAQRERERDLQDALMFLRIVLTRKDVTSLNCLKPKILDWMKRKGYTPNILRTEPMLDQDFTADDQWCPECGDPREACLCRRSAPIEGEKE